MQPLIGSPTPIVNQPLTKPVTPVVTPKAPIESAKPVQHTQASFHAQSLGASKAQPINAAQDSQTLKASVDQMDGGTVFEISGAIMANPDIAKEFAPPSPVKGVLALGGDDTVLGSAFSLAQKPGHTSMTMGDLGTLTSQDKLTIVGHGDADTFGGMRAEDLAQQLKDAGVTQLGKISLKGCNSVEFAQQLFTALQDKGIEVGSITGRTGDVAIAQNGRTLVSHDEQLLHQAQGSKFEVTASGLRDVYADHSVGSVQAKSQEIESLGHSGLLPKRKRVDEGGDEDYSSKHLKNTSDDEDDDEDDDELPDVVDDGFHGAVADQLPDVVDDGFHGAVADELPDVVDDGFESVSLSSKGDKHEAIESDDEGLDLLSSTGKKHEVMEDELVVTDVVAEDGPESVSSSSSSMPPIAPESLYSTPPKDIIAQPTQEHMDTLLAAIGTFNASAKTTADFNTLLDSAPGNSDGERQANFIHILVCKGTDDQREEMASLLEDAGFEGVFHDRVRDGEKHEQITTSKTVEAAIKDLRGQIEHSLDKDGNPITLMRLHRLTLTETRDMTWKGLSNLGFQNNHVSPAWIGTANNRTGQQQGKWNKEFHDELNAAFDSSGSTKELADHIFNINRAYSETEAGYAANGVDKRRASNTYVASDGEKYKVKEHHETLSKVAGFKRSTVLNELQGVRDLFADVLGYAGPPIAPPSPGRYETSITEASTPTFIQDLHNSNSDDDDPDKV